jgi:hypothetical protein
MQAGVRMVLDGRFRDVRQVVAEDAGGLIKANVVV